MKPGEIVLIVSGEHEGKRAIVKKSVGWFYNLQLLDSSGDKVEEGLVSLHKAAVSASR